MIAGDAVVAQELRAEVLDVLLAFLMGTRWECLGPVMNIAFGPGILELAKKELSFKGSWLRIFMIL